jgi:hypothetical protein
VFENVLITLFPYFPNNKAYEENPSFMDIGFSKVETLQFSNIWTLPFLCESYFLNNLAPFSHRKLTSE